MRAWPRPGRIILDQSLHRPRKTTCGTQWKDETEKSAVAYGGIEVARSGAAVPHDEAAVAAHVKQPEIEVEVRLGTGAGTARTIGIDLGPGYIAENVKTS